MVLCVWCVVCVWSLTVLPGNAPPGVVSACGNARRSRGAVRGASVAHEGRRLGRRCRHVRPGALTRSEVPSCVCVCVSRSVCECLSLCVSVVKRVCVMCLLCVCVYSPLAARAGPTTRACSFRGSATSPAATPPSPAPPAPSPHSATSPSSRRRRTYVSHTHNTYTHTHTQKTQHNPRTTHLTQAHTQHILLGPPNSTCRHAERGGGVEAVREGRQTRQRRRAPR